MTSDAEALGREVILHIQNAFGEPSGVYYKKEVDAAVAANDTELLTLYLKYHPTASISIIKQVVGLMRDNGNTDVVSTFNSNSTEVYKKVLATYAVASKEPNDNVHVNDDMFLVCGYVVNNPDQVEAVCSLVKDQGISSYSEIVRVCSTIAKPLIEGSL